jgi:hypothetical protein
VTATTTRQKLPAGFVERALASTREFLEPAVRHGIFAAPDPDKRDIWRQQVEQMQYMRDPQLPAETRAGIIELLKRAPRSRGRSRSYRNLLIHEAVRRLVKGPHQFAKTRGEATAQLDRRESACSIVAEALAQLGVTLKERAIEDIVRIRD